VIIKVKVKPNAKKNEVKQLDKDYFEVKTTAVAEKGKANQKVIELLSDYLNIPKSKITLFKGGKSREKLFKIED
jgi:uncharacterized protein (TIGR00251 family)